MFAKQFRLIYLQSKLSPFLENPHKQTMHWRPPIGQHHHQPPKCNAQLSKHEKKTNETDIASVLEFVGKFSAYESNRMSENDGDNLAIILSVIEGNNEFRVECVWLICEV